MEAGCVRKDVIKRFSNIGCDHNAIAACDPLALPHAGTQETGNCIAHERTDRALSRAAPNQSSSSLMNEF
jgi:hypothetical protein